MDRTVTMDFRPLPASGEGWAKQEPTMDMQPLPPRERGGLGRGVLAPGKWLT